MSRPLISVIMAVYNGERYLEEAIESVLNQTYSSIEFIVVDDGSTDSTPQIVQSYGTRLTYASQPHREMASARNRGIGLAQGDYFAFLDADDFWPLDKLEKQMIYFEQNPGTDLVSGLVRPFHSPETDEDFRVKVRCSEELLPAHVAGAMLVRREAFFKVGFFETEYKMGTDISWHLRAQEKKLRMAMLSHRVLNRRLHPKNHGIQNRHLAHQRLQALKASLDRRRGRS